MDATLRAILAELFRVSVLCDQLQARVAELEAQLKEQEEASVDDA